MMRNKVRFVWRDMMNVAKYDVKKTLQKRS